MHLRKRHRKPLSLKHHFTGAPEQRSPPKANIYASIYIYTNKHEAIHKPISENNIGAPWVPQKGAGRGDLAQHQLIFGVPMAVAHAHCLCLAAKCSKCEGQCLPGNRFAPTVWFSLVLLSIASLITLYIL